MMMSSDFCAEKTAPIFFKWFRGNKGAPRLQFGHYFNVGWWRQNDVIESLRKKSTR